MVLSDGAEGPRFLGETASPGPTRHVLDWFHFRCEFSMLHKQPKLPRGRKRISSTAICSRKRLTGSAGGYGTAAHKGLWIDRRTLGGTRDTKRNPVDRSLHQKAHRRFADLETYVSGHSIRLSIMLRRAFRRANLDGANESAVHRLLHRRMTTKQQMRWSPREHTHAQGADVRYERNIRTRHIALAHRRAASNVVPHNTSNFRRSLPYKKSKFHMRVDRSIHHGRSPRSILYAGSMFDDHWKDSERRWLIFAPLGRLGAIVISSVFEPFSACV